MSLVTYQPRHLLKELNQLMKHDWSSPSFEQDSFLSQWMPDLDVKETPKHILVSVDVPGMDKKDIQLSVENQRLTVEGERQETKDHKDENKHYVERHFGRFRRVITLPSSADSHQVAAKLEHGVLHITIDKQEKAKQKAITIQ